MKWLLLGAVLVPALFLIGMESSDPGELEPVEKLEVEKYLGKWYAVASMVKFFNRSCEWGNTAEYTLREDGRINVKNTCYTKKGEKREVTAVAWVPDESQPGKLKVSFVPVFGYRLFPADYWVIELGSGYDYAVVGHPSRDFGWILSREPRMKQSKIDQIAARLESAGYDFSDFKINPQTRPTS